MRNIVQLTVKAGLGQAVSQNRAASRTHMRSRFEKFLKITKIKELSGKICMRVSPGLTVIGVLQQVSLILIVQPSLDY
jgi:hypothetical protein